MRRISRVPGSRFKGAIAERVQSKLVVFDSAQANY